jgi:redox-sensitive bicupin YhaK (pirin superfamily)
MIVLRKAEERGKANYGWLDTRYTFSFANYYDRDYMGFRALRVINEDTVAPGAGFGKHGHRDMEILTYVTQGALEHKDSIGNGAVVRPGEVQRMSAGTGIMHSEFNHSKTESVRLLQIWLLPDTQGLPPSYEQRAFDLAGNGGKLQLVAAKDGRESAVKVHQDVDLYAAVMKKGDRLSHSLSPTRHGWLQVVRGKILLNNLSLGAGDGAAISEVEELAIAAQENAEFLLFDLA